MFALMVLIGAFDGSDALVAIVPMGVVFAKKLRLNPIVAAGITLLATMIGFATSPTRVYLAQYMMDMPIFSGFGFRFLNMVVYSVLGILYVVRYARKVQAEPMKSAHGNVAWQAELRTGDVAIKEAKLDVRDLLITILFFTQFILIVFCVLAFQASAGVTVAIQLCVALLCGFIHRMSLDEIGNAFTQGLQSMAFVCVLIGFANTLSLVMESGQIIATISYYFCLPLQLLGKGLAAVGMSIVVMILNISIPSANAKVAALIPIIKPMAANLSMSSQVAVQAFSIGDGFTNIISPFLGWTMGGLSIAKVPYQKWVKWVLPLLGVLVLYQFGALVVLGLIGW